MMECPPFLSATNDNRMNIQSFYLAQPITLAPSFNFIYLFTYSFFNYYYLSVSWFSSEVWLWAPYIYDTYNSLTVWTAIAATMASSPRGSTSSSNGVLAVAITEDTPRPSSAPTPTLVHHIDVDDGDEDWPMDPDDPFDIAHKNAPPETLQRWRVSNLYSFLFPILTNLPNTLFAGKCCINQLWELHVISIGWTPILRLSRITMPYV